MEQAEKRKYLINTVFMICIQEAFILMILRKRCGLTGPDSFS